MLTTEDIQTLEPFEVYLRNAQSDFMHHPGRRALKMMDEIYHKATGNHLVTDSSCSRCILNTLKRISTLYFASKEQNKGKSSPKKEKPVKSKKN